MKYHTALKSPVDVAPVQRIKVGDSVAFQHDIFRGLPLEYAVCDVLYADLPWADGFEIFEARAGKSGRNYESFLKAIWAVIEGTSKPVVVTVGKKGAKHLPTPENIYKTVLNGAPAVALAYRLSLTNHESTTAIVDELASRFSCMGNFCCGYGRTVKVFHDAGKRFVASDYNAKCIGVMGEWFK